MSKAETRYFKVLEESRKGEQTSIAIRRLCFLSLCRIQGDFWAESCPFPWQAVDIILLFTEILGQGSLVCSQFCKLWKDLYSHIAKWLFGVM